MLKTLYRSVMTTLILGIILCGAYPLLVYGIGNLMFHDKATGGILAKSGKAIGAKLIGQSFSKPEYFHGRPSSAGEKGYDASSSSGSNLGPTNQKFYDILKGNIENFLKDNPTVKKGEIPTNLVSSSGSGLDPHISQEGALIQVDRVAQARKTQPELLKSLIQKHLEGPQLGIFGEPVINVLALNIDLDEKYPMEIGSNQKISKE